MVHKIVWGYFGMLIGLLLMGLAWEYHDYTKELGQLICEKEKGMDYVYFNGEYLECEDKGDIYKISNYTSIKIRVKK